MDRRSFLMGTTLAGASGLAIPFLRAQSDSGISKRKLDRMAISSSSYRANYDGLNTSIPTVMPRLSHLTFGKYVKERFGITQIELWDQQWGLKTHAASDYTIEQCREIKTACDTVGVRVISIEVGDITSLADTDPAVHEQAIKEGKAWLDKAKAAGAGSIRIDPNRQTNAGDVNSIVDALKQITAYGRTIGMRVLIENHSGYTSNIAHMLEVIKAVNNDYCAGELDWGKWSPPGDRYTDMQAAMPYVYIVSAKAEVFDEQTYEHVTFDIAKLVHNAEAGGFKGIYSLELYGSPAPKDTDRAVRWMMKTIADNIA